MSVVGEHVLGFLFIVYYLRMFLLISSLDTPLALCNALTSCCRMQSVYTTT